MNLAFFVATASVCLSPAAPQSDAVMLKLKYAPGEKLVVTTEEKMQQTMSLPLLGQNQETRIDSSKSVLITNSKLSDKGEVTRTHTIQATKSDMQLPGGVRVQFDSAKPDETEAPQFPGGAQIVDGMRLSAKAKRIYKYDKSGKLIDASIAGLDIKSLPAQMQGGFSPELLRKTRMQQLKVLPTKPVKPGESWQIDSEISIGAGQTIKMKSKYTYKGMTDRGGRKYDLIESEVMDLSLQMAAGGPAGLQITESDVKPVKSTGKLWFDRSAGRIAASQSRMQMKGSMTLSVGGMEIDSNIDMIITTKTEVKPGR